MPQAEIKWRAPEFEYRTKDVSWYWVTIIIAVIILALAVWQKNFLFGFFVVVAEVLVLIWANREPSLVEFLMNERGLRIGSEKFHPFADMANFSLEPDDVPWPVLVFQSRKRLRPTLKVRVPQDRRPEIQNQLRAVLAEVEYRQSLLDAFEEYVGF